MNVSSIVVKTSAERLEAVVAEINAVPGCQVHFYDESGKIVATIEGETIGEEMDTMKRVQNIPHVLSAGLMYSCSEEEISEALHHLKDGRGAVPETLKS